MMRFVMTFDDTLCDGYSFGKLANFHFYWYCLSLKANFQKKIMEIHQLKFSWVS